MATSHSAFINSRPQHSLLTVSPQIVGPNPNSVPEAGLDTKARAPDIAQQLVQQIIAGADPDQQLEYNPVNWRFANGTTFLAQTNWLRPSVHLTINGRQDMFSQR